jgi:hypothetical protein
MVWVWMDGIFLVFLIIFAFSVWVVYLSELVKYLLIERYLAAKIGTILVVLVWQVFFITFDRSGFLIFFS